MELTRITKLLLWLLSKRPDIGELNVRDPDYWTNGLGTAVCDPDYIDSTLKSFTPSYHQMNNEPSKSITSDDCFGKSSTTKLLDVFIAKQAQLKNLEGIVAELRKRIQAQSSKVN